MYSEATFSASGDGTGFHDKFVCLDRIHCPIDHRGFTVLQAANCFPDHLTRGRTYDSGWPVLFL